MRAFRPNLEEVFEHYGARIFSSRGEWQKASCPLLSHDDTSPSASVNLEAGKWGCFSCGAKGDGLDVVQANEGTQTFNETVAKARELFSGEEVGGERKSSNSRGGRRNWTPPWTKL